ncbi:MAG TPA: MBL fold metallo-hydrolase [Bacillota bacterium]|nr:MBL fold metallo-hydrolase [Bacillota bacterium]HOA14817.1 MBL fold metallo-hydrolase [Bacillota bacterium]
MDLKIARLIVGPIQTNCYIAYMEGAEKAVCIDPGANEAKVLGRLHGLGLGLDSILLTHWHPDHIGAAGELRAETGARVLIGALDADRLDLTKDDFGLLQAKPSGFRSADSRLVDGEERTAAGIRFLTMLTPGHTPGGVCYYIPGEKVLFSGDTLFFGSVGRTDLVGGDFESLRASVLGKLFALDDDVRVLPGHGPETTIGRERLRVTALLNAF